MYKFLSLNEVLPIGTPRSGHYTEYIHVDSFLTVVVTSPDWERFLKYMDQPLQYGINTSASGFPIFIFGYNDPNKSGAFDFEKGLNIYQVDQMPQSEWLNNFDPIVRICLVEPRTHILRGFAIYSLEPKVYLKLKQETSIQLIVNEDEEEVNQQFRMIYNSRTREEIRKNVLYYYSSPIPTNFEKILSSQEPPISAFSEHHLVSTLLYGRTKEKYQLISAMANEPDNLMVRQCGDFVLFPILSMYDGFEGYSIDEKISRQRMLPSSIQPGRLIYMDMPTLIPFMINRDFQKQYDNRFHQVPAGAGSFIINNTEEHLFRICSVEDTNAMLRSGTLQNEIPVDTRFYMTAYVRETTIFHFECGFLTESQAVSTYTYNAFNSEEAIAISQLTVLLPKRLLPALFSTDFKLTKIDPFVGINQTSLIFHQLERVN